jgi:cytochrome c-type biogenesis protein CcmH
MTTFLVLSGLLIAVALALLLPPLVTRRGAAAARNVASNSAVYGEQLAELNAELHAGTLTCEQWSAARSEIERRALDEAPEAPMGAAWTPRSRFAAVALGVGIPLAAIALYAFLGNPRSLLPESGPASPPPHAVTRDQIASMVAKLAARLEKNPGDSEGWMMLGRSYTALGRFADAATAYSKATEQRPSDAQLLADYADALALAHGRNLFGEPEALIARALKADPNNVKALALAGTVAFDRRDYRGAIAYWQRIAPLVPGDSEFARSMRSNIAEARDHLRSSSPSSSLARAATSDAVKPEAALLQGTVSLGSGAEGKAQPEDFVFVFARAAAGPRMPLAVVRRQVKDLPFEFSLDDSMAMNPSLKLSDFDKVVVVARVSRSGNPSPQKGDLEVATTPLAPRTKGIRLEIMRVVE